SAQAQLQDAGHTLSTVLRHTDLEPERLAELDQRMATWMGLARRFRKAPDELPEVLSSWKQELAEVEAAADLEALERDAQAAHQAWLKVAQAVSRQRTQAAPRLAEA